MEIKIGQKASFTKTISESDIYTFAGISGDFNPVHVNEEEARNSIFGERIAHGMLGASLISTVLGTKLPGPGTIYMGQSLSFKAPVYIGDTICAIVEVKELRPKKQAVLHTMVKNQEGKIVIEGEALVKLL